MASETSQTAGLAGRYATALYDLAHDANALDQVSADLAKLKALLQESADARHLIGSPLIPRAQQARAMAALAEKAGLGDLARRFVGVVASNRRLARLPDLIDSFESLLARRRGDIEAEVVSAVPLTPDQHRAIAAAIPGATGRKVRLRLKVDPKLIGGLRIKFGSRLVDASVAAKLSRLQLAMKGTA
ncbi:MAG: F0F1 ATP synthase subunit delta [Rhodospirillales bacterium]